jgi:hypothetical protein
LLKPNGNFYINVSFFPTLVFLIFYKKIRNFYTPQEMPRTDVTKSQINVALEIFCCNDRTSQVHFLKRSDHKGGSFSPKSASCFQITRKIVLKKRLPGNK